MRVDTLTTARLPPVPRVDVRAPIGPLKVAAITATTQGVATPEGALNALRRAIASGADIVVAPEWFFVCGGDTGAYTALIRQVLALTAGSDTLVIPGSMAMCDRQNRYRNNAVACCNGKPIALYAKRHDGADSWVGLALGAKAWQPGQRASFFEWRGRTVALEICADHQQGAAKGDMRACRRGPADLHIVISSGASIRAEAVVAREGGAVLGVDGTPEHSRVEAYRLRSGRFEPGSVGRKEPCGATTITHLVL